MRFALIDFETSSACDLKKAGAWRYAEDPTTEILCLGYTIDGAAPELLTPDQLLQRYGPLWDTANDPEVIFIAHNVFFEKAIWRNIMVLVFGWPDIPDERWHDTMAVCAMKGIPLKLERALSALRLSNVKDTEGTRATLALGRTNKRGYFDWTPEKLERVYTYCRDHDVPAELELHRRMRGLGTSERKVWLLDQKINQRGIMLDMGYVANCQRVVDQATGPLHKEFVALTGIEKLASPKLKDWVFANGVTIPNLQKETIAKLIGVDYDQEDEDTLAGEDNHDEESAGIVLPPSVLRALQIRAILGSASVKKLVSMRACAGGDGRARGLLQYHGAGPGRWAGRLLQPQNFPRPSLKISIGFDAEGNEKFGGHNPDQLVAAINTGDAEYVRMLFGEPIEAVANGLRHSLIAAPGKLFEVGDFAQIEARIVLALAGQHDKCDLMAKGMSPYIPMAEDIFKRKIDKHVDIKEYTIGKNTVLGCGFQMGAKKFHSRYCPGETMEFAQRAIDAYRKEFAPMVPKLWYALEEAAVKTVWDRQSYEAYGIQYKLEDGWLTARLPSGRRLWYYNPQPVRKAMPWNKDDIRLGFEYSAQKAGQWKRVSAYGGLLTENVVQATARDMLVNALFNAEADNHPVVLTVHDEAVLEVDEALASIYCIRQYMEHQPDWVRALRVPVAGDYWIGERYRK